MIAHPEMTIVCARDRYEQNDPGCRALRTIVAHEAEPGRCRGLTA